MWLYVPLPSTSSPSAPVEPDSISDSNWRFPALEASAWWRGKPSPSRTWWQRWNRVSWLRRLCGAMCEPSTADAGVAAWTASLAASRASRTAPPDASLGVNDELADSVGAGREGGERAGAPEERNGPAASGSASEFRRAPLLHAERSERRPDAGGGYQPDRNDGGRDQATGRTGEPGAALVDADSEIQPTWCGQSDESGRRRGLSGERRDRLSLYPPRPADRDGWRRVLAHSPHLEPAVCRMADGVAARVDLAGPHAVRVERLRMLGNGVVSLEGAYAFRTLTARLAARGSAAAARLVRMMV